MAVILHVSATQGFRKISSMQERERQMGFFCPNIRLDMKLLEKSTQPSKVRRCGKAVRDLKLRESQEQFNSWKLRNPCQQMWPT